MIELYGKQNCGFCTQAIALLESSGVEYKKYYLNEDITVEEFTSKFPDVRTVPLICKDGERIGGYQALKDYMETKE